MKRRPSRTAAPAPDFCHRNNRFMAEAYPYDPPMHKPPGDRTPEKGQTHGSSRDDQWIALIFHPSSVRVRTISSAPVEFTDFPRNLPRAVLVAVVQATLPRTRTRSDERVPFTAWANAMSAAR